MNDDVLRRAARSDAVDITALMQAAYSVYLPVIGGPLPPLEADYAAELEHTPAWVIEKDGTICGAVFLMPREDHMLLVNVAVDPAYQGQGLGRRLIEKAEAEARDQGYTEIRLFTHAKMSENIDLYTRLGWHEYDRREQAGVPRVFMRKSLT
ncbi:MAG: GNAT family N-acetyltransferase [Alphaproteobacteria bacterium]|nr:GNAT family N-acetyltransferase [Alphaproteobacteria bacterium]